MSASPIARSLCSTNSHPIPSKKVLINDPNQMPDVYSSTPNGTCYSTTPGGKFCHYYFDSCYEYFQSLSFIQTHYGINVIDWHLFN